MNKSYNPITRFQYATVRRPRFRCWGVAAVEFALTAPLVFLLLFGALELSHANMVYNSTEAAAYEGARCGIVPGASAAECIAAAQRILAIAKITGAEVQVVPSDLKTVTQTIRVTINVPYASNSLAPPKFTKSLIISRACVLTREKL